MWGEYGRAMVCLSLRGGERARRGGGGGGEVDRRNNPRPCTAQPMGFHSPSPPPPLALTLSPPPPLFRWRMTPLSPPPPPRAQCICGGWSTRQCGGRPGPRGAAAALPTSTQVWGGWLRNKGCTEVRWSDIAVWKASSLCPPPHSHHSPSLPSSLTSPPSPHPPPLSLPTCRHCLQAAGGSRRRCGARGDPVGRRQRGRRRDAALLDAAGRGACLGPEDQGGAGGGGGAERLFVSVCDVYPPPERKCADYSLLATICALILRPDPRLLSPLLPLPLTFLPSSLSSPFPRTCGPCAHPHLGAQWSTLWPSRCPPPPPPGGAGGGAVTGW